MKRYWDPASTAPLTDRDRRVIALHEQLHRDYISLYTRIQSKPPMTEAEKAEYNRKTDEAIEKVLRDAGFIIPTEKND